MEQIHPESLRLSSLAHQIVVLGEENRLIVTGEATNCVHQLAVLEQFSPLLYAAEVKRRHAHNNGSDTGAYGSCVGLRDI